jgi:hypothetical protein
MGMGMVTEDWKSLLVEAAPRDDNTGVMGLFGTIGATDILLLFRTGGTCCHPWTGTTPTMSSITNDAVVTTNCNVVKVKEEEALFLFLAIIIVMFVFDFVDS